MDRSRRKGFGISRPAIRGLIGGSIVGLFATISYANSAAHPSVAALLVMVAAVVIGVGAVVFGALVFERSRDREHRGP